MNKERLEELAEKFKGNEFEAYVFETKEEARDFILNLCVDKSIGIGDSHTIEAIGLIEALKEQKEIVYACRDDKTRENKLKSLTADIFLLSANAVAEDTGELVNIDSSCNRIAGSLYGPNEVMFVIGRNKIAPNLEQAIYRAKNLVAPMNAKEHNYNLPCVTTGKCHNCQLPQRVCRVTVIYHKKPKTTKATIILVNEDLGF